MSKPTRRVMFISHEGALIEWDVEDDLVPATYTLKRRELEDMIKAGLDTCMNHILFFCYRGSSQEVNFDFFRVMWKQDCANVSVYLERIV